MHVLFLYRQKNQEGSLEWGKDNEPSIDSAMIPGR